jgi:hypothetical protein
MVGNIKVGEELNTSYLPDHSTNAHCQKIRDRQLAAPALSETLQDLVLNELKEKKHTATEGLLWLNRYAFPTIARITHH